MFSKSKEKLYSLIQENPGITLVAIAILVGLLMSDNDLLVKAKTKLNELL